MDENKNSQTIKHSSAGNLITLTVNKYYDLVDLTIHESMIDLSQKDLLEEMILSTVNEAIDKMIDINEKKIDSDKTETTPFNLDPNKMPDFKNMNMNKMVGDLSKFTSIKYENGKPVLTMALDGITPDILMNMMNMKNNTDDDDDTK